MTQLMQRLLAEPMRQRFKTLGTEPRTGSLVELLASQPRILVTTSHGATMVNQPQLAATLGSPVVTSLSPVTSSTTRGVALDGAKVLVTGYDTVENVTYCYGARLMRENGHIPNT